MKYTLTTQKFIRMKGFAWLKNEICSEDIAFVDNVAKKKLV